MKKRCLFAIVFTLFFLRVTSAGASTTCQTGDCKITITIHIAFSGATDQQIDSWKQDIENTWNGSGQTTGDCNCPVTFKVDAMKITNPAQANCNPPPAGYHCVMVTPFATNPPVDTHGNTYVAYMYPPGKAVNGQSLKGWWSDATNRPSPDGGIYHDAAHEAGHMMGLDDGDGNGLMTNTSGPNAKPTQQNIDDVVKNICGQDACPDRCCCGNGVIESDKGESCDPLASPSGCGAGEFCCPVCCSCYRLHCNPEKGEYASISDCQAACSDSSSKCYLNYKTGCWDCVRLKMIEHKPVYDESRIKQCAHMPIVIYELLKGLISYDFSGLPEFCPQFSEQLVNLYIEGAGAYSLATGDCHVIEVNFYPSEVPTWNAYTDIDTVLQIAREEITVTEAMASGRIVVEPAEPPAD